MAPYQLFDADLEVMELSESKSTLTLTLLKDKYLRLARVLHPDKNPPGEKDKFTALFQELFNSYSRLSVYVTKITDVNDIESESEEAYLYECFSKCNIVIDNIGSTTVLVENHLARQWNDVLTATYGLPSTKSKKDGSKWKVTNYADSGRDITITKWDEPKSDSQTKILLQSGGDYDRLFVAMQLPVLYQKVLQFYESGTDDSAESPAGASRLAMRRSLRTTITNTPRGYPTYPKRRSSAMTPLPRVNKRLKMKALSKTSFLKTPTTPVTRRPAVAMPGPSTPVSMSASPPSSQSPLSSQSMPPISTPCTLCSMTFHNSDEVRAHIREVHTFPCPSCGSTFVSYTHLTLPTNREV